MPEDPTELLLISETTYSQGWARYTSDPRVCASFDPYPDLLRFFAIPQVISRNLSFFVPRHDIYLSLVSSLFASTLLKMMQEHLADVALGDHRRSSGPQSTPKRPAFESDQGRPERRRGGEVSSGACPAEHMHSHAKLEPGAYGVFDGLDSSVFSRVSTDTHVASSRDVDERRHVKDEVSERPFGVPAWCHRSSLFHRRSRALYCFSCFGLG